jgi:hypothetical protein
VCIDINGQGKCFASNEKMALSLPDGDFAIQAWIQVAFVSELSRHPL